jgi:hypothetical protein
MRSLQSVLVAATLALGVSLSVSAHHSRANFNQDEVIEFQGTVTEYSWRNPHTFAKLAVKTDSGETKELLLELNSISVLTRAGWTRETINVGDEVTVFANPDRDSNKNLYYANYFVLPDGQMIASAPGSAPDTVPRAPRRQPDRTASTEDLGGIWRAEGGRRGGGQGARGGEGGGDATGRRSAVSLGGQTPATGLPVTAFGKAELEAWDAADNPWFQCVSKTSPWLFNAGGAHQITLENEDTIIISHEVLDVRRTVHLGITEQPNGIEPSHLGYSIGWYEGETLVVDTAHFAPAKWGIGNGISSSDKKHLTERFTLVNEGRGLRFDYTLEDSVYLTEPVSMSQTFYFDPEYPWQEEYGCDPEASSRHLTNIETP